MVRPCCCRSRPSVQTDEWKGGDRPRGVWWVSTMDDESSANMAFVEKGRTEIPCLVNTNVVEAHEEMYRCKAEAVPVPLAGAEGVEATENPPIAR
ncbi:hypothetical protein N9L68_02325 [bacterium]|nr:hypothetical protein [bacterium]